MPQPAMPLANESRDARSDIAWADSAWKQLVTRDPQARFFYGVATTGVFCRPTCASRRPLRANVRFFRTAADALTAGFRACKRCRPRSHRRLHRAAFWTKFVATSNATSTGACVLRS